jgi:hypothetical protein
MCLKQGAKKAYWYRGAGRTNGRGHLFVLDFFVSFCIKAKRKRTKQDALLSLSTINTCWSATNKG